MNVKTLVVGFIKTNCYIAYNGKDAVVIDPGADAEGILAAAQELGVEIKYVFLTHAHFDHVLAADEVIRQTGAKLVAHAAEKERMCDAELSGQTMLRRRKFIPLYADVEIVGGGSIDVGDMHFEFIPTPGHTEGSMCIICGDTMFSGDTLFAGTCGRCDLAGGSYSEIMKSLKKLYELPGDYKVLPGHECATTLENERKTNPYMAEAMRS